MLIPFFLCFKPASLAEAYGTQQVNKFMRGIYAGEVFLPSLESRALSESLKEFVRSYAFLASKFFDKGISAFPMVPKLHAVHEIAHSMEKGSYSSSYTLNPAALSCSIDEDFVGRTAKISRQVSPRAICIRTLQRYLVHIQVLWCRDQGSW